MTPNEKIKTVSDYGKISVEHLALPSNCTVYLIHETQGAERDYEADVIAKIFADALNEYIKSNK